MTKKENELNNPHTGIGAYYSSNRGMTIMAVKILNTVNSTYPVL